MWPNNSDLRDMLCKLFYNNGIFMLLIVKLIPNQCIIPFISAFLFLLFRRWKLLSLKGRRHWSSALFVCFTYLVTGIRFKGGSPGIYFTRTTRKHFFLESLTSHPWTLHRLCEDILISTSCQTRASQDKHCGSLLQTWIWWCPRVPGTWLELLDKL